MRYVITESKLEESILYYINELFDVNDIHSTHPTEYDEETSEEWDDENRVIFYVGDYEGEDEGCFYWYGCEYFNPNSRAGDLCPTVSVEFKYKKQLDGFFGDLWHGPFRKWFKEHFGLPVKTIE